MKTLIISGTTKMVRSTADNKVFYDITLFGQTAEHPLCVYITSLKLKCRGFNEMQDIARAKFAAYFNTDLFNIISMENLTILD